MAQQSPLNLNPQALATLLEALTALNLNANNASVSTPATTTASASAPASSSASAEGGAAPASASLSPAQVPITSMDTPVVLLNPLTRGPLSSSMQAGPSSSSSRVPPTQQPPAQVHMGFHCSYCGVFNPAVGQSSEAFYVVTAGREVGIFTSWEVIQPLVSGVAHACHKKYKTCSEAEEAFQIALGQGKVRVL